MFEGINPSSMKRILPALVFILLLSRSVNLYSQIVAKGYSTPVMQAFQKGKTFAVLTNDETFNQWFRQALQKQWTINQLQFITAGKAGFYRQQ
jgi:ABC-type branched-subunit amino acid transport system substrate-binding protein